MESLTHAYFRLTEDLDIDRTVREYKEKLKSAAQEQNISIDDYIAEHKAEISAIYKQADVSIICDLMALGFSWREVMENYATQPLILQEYDNPEDIQSHDETNFIKKYTDEVLELVNQERYKRSKADFLQASEAYTSIKNNLSKKYLDDDDKFSEYHDGEIIISMLVNEGYPEKTVADVLKKISSYDDLYIKGLMEKCLTVKRAYSDIQRAEPISNVRNEFDVYRSFAKEHMAKLGIKLLSYNDDLAIFEQLKAMKLPDHYIKRAMLKASPVAHEPGRDKTAYVEAVLSGNDNHNEFTDGLNRVPVMDAEQQYKGLIEYYNGKLKKKGITNGVKEGINRAYFDVLAVKELFDKHYLEQDIIHVLKVFSPEAQSQAFPGYALWVSDKAKKLIEKEQFILSKPKIELPENGSYADITAQGISPKDIVISLLQQRIELNPSIRQMLHKPFVDKDLAESALHRYPDFDLDALKGIFADFPRSIILSGSNMAEEKDYIDNVIEAAQKRIDKQKENNKEAVKIQEAFREKQEILHQGVVGETANMKMSIYHVGRTALAMMKNNLDEMQLRKMIINNVDASDGQIEAITNDIIRKNREVIARIKAVDEYAPKEKSNSNNESSPPAEFYLSRLALQHKLRKAINASMDPEIVRDMLASRAFKKSDIKDTVEALSPIAAQPGRGRDYYFEYVYPTAVSLLRTEKDKLHTYHPDPRIQKEEEAAKEYDYHKKQIMAAIALPFEAAMDVLIAETMLLQGYPSYEIASALDDLSPCSESQESYGLSITKKAESNTLITEKETIMETTIEETYENNQLIQSRVLSRNLTENIKNTTEGGNT